MTTHEFLSPEWIDAALAIHDEYAERLPAAPTDIRMNLVVTEVPHGEGRIEASIVTAEHGTTPQPGHIADPELTVTLDYGTARALFLEQNPEAVGQAFFAGKILIDGDITRVFMLQAIQPSATDVELGNEINARLQAITDS